MTMAKRLKGMGSAKYQTDGDPRTSGPGFGIAVHPDALATPLRWRKPKRIFVNSMSDLFHDGVPDEFIIRIFAVMAASLRHTYQLLTKRHARMRALLSSPDFSRRVLRRAPYEAIDPYVKVAREWPLPNLWVGVSVEDQQWADIRIPALLQTPATVRWVSCEPLIGTLNLQRWLERDAEREGTPCLGPGGNGSAVHRLNWIVCGGESGPDARPMHPEWARSLRNQCQLAGVPFFFKQWGDWAQVLDGATHRVTYGGEHYPNTPTCLMSNEELIRRVGKHVAGRVLDGRTWSEYPEVAHA